MSKWDDEYIKLCKTILKEGTRVENRTGTDTIKIPGYFLEFDLQKEFPVLTTKKLYFRQAILEMLWIYQAQSNDVRWLKERNVNIWNEWEIDKDGFWNATQMLPDENGNLVKTEVRKEFGKEYAHTIGTAYGYIVKKFGLTDKILNMVNKNRRDRRMVISLWQDEYLETAVLPSCVWSTEWDITNDTINIWVHQRSADVPLGLPFNVTQYATLLSLIAHVSGLKPGKIFWSIKDAHIYENQIDGIKEQIRRYEEKGSYEAPKLWLNPDIKNFYDFDNSKDLKDIQIKDYKDMGPIKMDISQ